MMGYAELTVDLSEVVRFGGVEQAIREAAYRNNYFLVEKTLNGQAVHVEKAAIAAIKLWDSSFNSAGDCQPSEAEVIDPEDGRLVRGIDTYGLDDQWDEKIEWEDDSCVELEIPDFDDALDNPVAFGEMAKSAFETHGACSDLNAWAELLNKIRKLSDSIDDIDIEEHLENKMRGQYELEKLAKSYVACYKDEFPGEGPDWDSDWWCSCQSWEDGEFSVFLEICKKVW